MQTAISELALGNLAAATTTYHKLETISANGASRAALGLADVALYEGRLSEAATLLETGIRNDQATHQAATAANKKYDISFTATPTLSTFTVQAVPANSQTSDICGTLTLSNTGAQTAATTNCW